MVGLRTQILGKPPLSFHIADPTADISCSAENISILSPRYIGETRQEDLDAALIEGVDTQTHIITIVDDVNKWTALWMSGQTVILQPEGAMTAVGALEKLLERTSVLLRESLMADGSIEGKGRATARWDERRDLGQGMEFWEQFDRVDG